MTTRTELYEDAQEKLVAILLANGDLANTVINDIAPDDFSTPQYELLYNTIRDLVHDSIPVTETTVATRLEEKGDLVNAGGVAHIAQMKDNGKKYLLDAPVNTYVSILKSASVKNKLHENLNSVLKGLTTDSGVSGAQAIEKVRTIVENLQGKVTTNTNTSTMLDLLREYEDRLAKRKQQVLDNANMGGVIGIPTSLPTLTDITGGWKGGQFICVGARSGIGKSVFAVNQATTASQYGKSVLFFSLEMSREELEDRIVSSISGTPQWRLQRGDYDKKTFEETKNELRTMNITIDENASTTMDMIRAKAIEQAKSEQGLDMLIIDYIQLLHITNPSGNRERDMANVSRQCKVIAKELDIPVIGVIQMNRAKDKEEAAQAPNDFNVRESNAFLTDCDIMMILHRYDAGDATLPNTDIIVGKHRGGKKGDVIKCASNLSISLFTEAEEDKDMEDVDKELGIDADFDFDELDSDFLNGEH